MPLFRRSSPWDPPPAHVRPRRPLRRPAVRAPGDAVHPPAHIRPRPAWPGFGAFAPRTPQYRRGRLRGAIAGLAGASLLLTGSTWAVWTDTTSSNGGEIVLGNLGIDQVGDVLWIDRSTDRTDSTVGVAQMLNESLGGATQSCFSGATSHAIVGHPIDADYSGTDPGAKPWHASPKDSVAAVFPYSVALEGDNMVAKVTVAINPNLFVDHGALDGGAIAVDAYLDGVLVGNTTSTAAAASTVDLAYVQAENENWGDPDGTYPVVTQHSTSLNPNLCVVVSPITVGDLAGQDYAKAGDPDPGAYKYLVEIGQGAITVGLTQIRDSGRGIFT